MITLGRQAPESEALAQHLEPDWVARAVEAAGDIAYRWNILTDGLAWGGSLKELLGETNDEIQSGHGLNTRIHPEDLPIRLKALSDHFAGHASYDCEYRLRNNQGGVVWVHDRANATLDAHKTPIAM